MGSGTWVYPFSVVLSWGRGIRPVYPLIDYSLGMNWFWKDVVLGKADIFSYSNVWRGLIAESNVLEGFLHLSSNFMLLVSIISREKF